MTACIHNETLFLEALSGKAHGECYKYFCDCCTELFALGPFTCKSICKTQTSCGLTPGEEIMKRYLL